MPTVIEKVTAFITRQSQAGTELLLFEHPYAGTQIPAGTVEDGENPEDAVLREATEETGLDRLPSPRYLGQRIDQLPERQRIIARNTRVYARPDLTSFDWAWLRRGVPVVVNRRTEGFCQVTYIENDQEPNPQYVSMAITGWVPDGAIADTRKRHFFLLEFRGQSEEHWTVHTDNHHFSLFWAPVDALPEVIPPQNAWLEFLYSALDA